MQIQKVKDVIVLHLVVIALVLLARGVPREAITY